MDYLFQLFGSQSNKQDVCEESGIGDHELDLGKNYAESSTSSLANNLTRKSKRQKTSTFTNAFHNRPSQYVPSVNDNEDFPIYQLHDTAMLRSKGKRNNNMHNQSNVYGSPSKTQNETNYAKEFAPHSSTVYRRPHAPGLSGSFRQQEIGGHLPSYYQAEQREQPQSG